jgi:hypothetical protein
VTAATTSFRRNRHHIVPPYRAVSATTSFDLAVLTGTHPSVSTVEAEEAQWEKRRRGVRL